MPSEKPLGYDYRLDKVILELFGSPFYDNMIVLVKDPENPDQYLRILLNVRYEGRRGNLTRLYHKASLLGSERGPLKKDIVFETACDLMKVDPKEYQNTCFSYAVGIAEYCGREKITIKELVPLIGSKYYQMRFFNSN